ncbi:MAG: substrate-binding domain-containing protein, partial [Anaerolineales bacterium]|nr:substrate-binding domain-containing protein [Anaerolineales bacterium]
AGIQVPNEFSVTGFDNIVFSAFTNPPLTTFDQPKRFIGAEAARLVLELLNAPPAEDASEPRAGTGTTTQPTLVPCSSTGKVRRLKGRLLVRETTALPTASSRKS